MSFSNEWAVVAMAILSVFAGVFAVITPGITARITALFTAVLRLARFCFNQARIPRNAIHAEALDFDVNAGLACGLTFDLLRPCDITKVLEDHEGSDDDAADLPVINELPGDPLLEADGPGANF